MAFGFRKVCIVQAPAVPLHLQFCIAYSALTASMSFKQHFHKLRETYLLTNQRHNLPNFESDCFNDSLVFDLFWVVTENHNLT